MRFTRVSEDGEQEFPGKIRVHSWYLVNVANQLLMVWTAEALSQDKPTPINLTNHAYWNLSGDFSDTSVAQHEL